MCKNFLLIAAFLIHCLNYGWAGTIDVLACDNDTDAPVIVYPSQNLQIQLDACAVEQSGLAVFYIEAIDECDSNPLLEVTISAGSGGTYFLENPYGKTFFFSGTPDTYTVMITATDESGNLATEDFMIVVEQAPLPPAGNSCNDTINVSLNANCQRVISPDMLVEGLQGCLPNEFYDISITDEQPANGDTLDGVGMFAYEIVPQQPLSTDGFTGSFAPNHWMLQAASPGEAFFSSGTDSLSLRGGNATAMLSIPYDGNLQFNLEASLINSPAHLRVLHLNSAHQIVFSDDWDSDVSQQYDLPLNRGDKLFFILSDTEGTEDMFSSAVISSWEFTFEEVDFGDFISCWGIVNAIDVSPPALECPPTTSMGTRYISYSLLSGTLDEDDSELNTATYSCLIENFNEQGLRYYDLLPFEVSETDVYTFFLLSDFTEGGGDMALFHSFFNPNNPCSNIMAQADFPQGFMPNGNDPFIRLSLPLQAGTTYYLLTTSDVPEATGDYEYQVNSDGNGELLGAEAAAGFFSFPLYCEDANTILNTDSIQWTGLPVLSDNCSDPGLQVDDELLTFGDCGDIRILRTFEASDQEGNVSSCIQQINFLRPSIEAVSLPPFTAIIECDEFFPIDEFGNPAPEHTGYPFISAFSGISDLNDSYCNIGATYEDGPLIEVCLLSYQFVRTWTITDWCDPASTITYQQVIKIGDFTPPEVSAPIVDLDGDGFPDPLIYSTGPFECAAAFSVPLPMVSDNCSTWEVVREVIQLDTIINYDGQGQAIDTTLEETVLAVIDENSPDAFVGDIPIGCHLFRYIVTDECDNTSLLDCEFCVVDEVEPVAVCDSSLHVSLGANGQVRLFSINFDGGSWDNCGIDSLLIRRTITLNEDCEPISPFTTPWNLFVDFDCCEIGNEVGVELLVRDIYGNENTCWADVLVEDKLRPSCIPPEAVSIDCDDLPDDFVADSLEQLQLLFGAAEANDNCSASWEELPPINNLDECGFGTLIRRFIATDESGNTSTNLCQQIISVEERHNYEIRFPKDAEGNCGLPNPLDTITYSEIGCDLLAVSVDDEILSASGDECFKIFRTYRVINWCEYDGDSDPQVIGRDEDCDEQTGEEDVWVLRRPARTFIDRDNDETNAIPLAGEKGVICDGNTNEQGYWRQTVSNGFWEYQQLIKVYDTIAPQILFVTPSAFCSEDNVTCRAEVEYPFVLFDVCTPDDLEITVFYDEFADGTVDSVITDIFGTYPKWKVAGDYPIGMHEFEVVVVDGCGNTASAILPFTVADCLAPTPICINGLAAPLMPVPPGTDADGDGDIDRGALTVFAETFVASTQEDCVGPVTYSINRIGEVPSRDQEALIVTCDDLGALVVEIYAWDSANNPYAIQPDSTVGGANYDFCETFILVQNNLADCNGGMMQVAGVVEKENGIPVAGVEMQLSGDGTQSIMTDTLGSYLFDFLEEGYDYTVTPFKDGDYQNGLSTFDIVLMSNHILGLMPLTSPYKLIAADVNNSGSVSTLDIIQLRQLILGVITELPNSNSWRFVPKEHVFEDPLNPWLEPVPYALNYNNLTTSQLEEEYIAIKVGDIDLTATSSDFQEIENRTHTASSMLTATDQYLEKGQSYEIAFHSNEGHLIGLQGVLSVDTDKLLIEALLPATMNKAHWNTRYLEQGIIPFSWNAHQAINTREPMLKLRLKALQSGRLSEAVRLEEEGLLKAEAYLHDQPIPNKLQLAIFNQLATHRVFPNPFTNSTTLLYEADYTGSTRLLVYDAHGSLIYQQNPACVPGSNKILIDRKHIRAAGLYYYQLEMQGRILTGKLAVH
jgi:hypothetical protein